MRWNVVPHLIGGKEGEIHLLQGDWLRGECCEILNRLATNLKDRG